MEHIEAKKIGMTQLPTEKGGFVPVTLVLIGDKKAAMPKIGNTLIVRGTSKGKGFQGGMKRHGFKGAPHSHGHKHDWRKIGSIGSAFPERVWKGRKMPGHMGAAHITVKNLTVIRVDESKRLVAIKGALPGSIGSVVTLKSVNPES